MALDQKSTQTSTDTAPGVVPVGSAGSQTNRSSGQSDTSDDILGSTDRILSFLGQVPQPSGEQTQPEEPVEPEKAEQEVPNEEVPPEETAPVEAESEEAEDEDKKTFSPSLQRKFDKLTARIKALEEENQALKTPPKEESEPVFEAPAPPQKDNGVLESMDASQLVSAEKRYSDLRDTLDDYLDGAASESQRKRIEKIMEEQGIQEPELKRLRRTVDKLIEHGIPERRRYLEAERAANQKARELFPFMADKTSADYATAQQVLATLPEIKRLPHWQIVAATYVRGLNALKEAQKKPEEKPKVVPPQTLPPKAQKPTAAPPRKPQNQEKLNAKKSTFLQTGSQEDLADLLAIG